MEQAPPPLHMKLAQAPSGSVLTGWLLHVPTDPARLQASQPPGHAELQQTPSLQLPETHSHALVHVAPLALSATHAAELQLLPVLHTLLQIGKPPQFV